MSSAPYHLVFTLAPPLPETQPDVVTRYMRAKERKAWHELVGWELKKRDRPYQPLPEAELVLTRYGCKPVDPDNLAYSFKAIVDGITFDKKKRPRGMILLDDKAVNVGTPQYRWVKVHHKNQERIKIEVYEAHRADPKPFEDALSAEGWSHYRLGHPADLIAFCPSCSRNELLILKPPEWHDQVSYNQRMLLESKAHFTQMTEPEDLAELLLDHKLTGCGR